MEAKDTVIDKLRMHSILADEREKSDRSIIRAMTQLRNEQAEISFRAGIKEVVELVNIYNPMVGIIASDIGYFIETPVWQAKLKEWGIKEV